MNESQAPKGFMKNAEGHFVPDAMVKPIDRARDELVRELVLQARDVSALLLKFKNAAFADIAAFIQLSAEQYDAKVGGEKGNVTMYSFDGSLKVERRMQQTLRFDERLQAAKALIDECITEWASNARPEIQVLINDAFRVNQEGAVQTDRVLALRRLDIKDEKWLRAMDAIAESLQVIGSKPYVRLYERVGDTDQYRPIAMDLASV